MKTLNNIAPCESASILKGTGDKPFSIGASFIYSLNCPKTDEVRYIGKTNDITYRLRKHIEEALRGVKTHKCNWIRSVLATGAKPTLTIIDTVNNDEWIFWEKHYISLYKSWGFKLTNGTLGGDGISIMNDDLKYKISQSNKGNKKWLGKQHTLESKSKMSKSAKGRKMKDISKNKISDFFSKQIAQYSKDGTLIKVWKNSEQVRKEAGIYHTLSCANGKRKTAGGFVWKFKPKNLTLPDRFINTLITK